LSAAELDRAESLRWQDASLDKALRSGGVSGPFQRLAGGPVAVEQWQVAENSDDRRVGAAFIRAAVDFRRAGYAARIPEDALLAAYPGYLRGADPCSASDAMAQLAWACESPYGLEPCLRAANGTYRVFDALVDHAQRAHQGHNPVDRTVWELALELSDTDPDMAFQIGQQALMYWERDVAIRAFQLADGQGHPDAAYSLGWLL
jgi:hypothetical protein